MAGPARAGLFVYAKSLERVADFYAAVADMQRLHATEDLVVLQSSDLQLLVHRIPPHIAQDLVITVPAQRRDECALKFFFSVDSLAQTGQRVADLGGVVDAEQWTGPGFVVRNACDPEGNVFQIRQFLE